MVWWKVNGDENIFRNKLNTRNSPAGAWGAPKALRSVGCVFDEISEKTPKSYQIPVWSCILPEWVLRMCRRQLSSVLVDQTSCDATNDHQSLRNYPLGSYRANGSVWIGWPALHFRQKKIKIFWKSQKLKKILITADTRKSRYPRSVFGTRM